MDLLLSTWKDVEAYIGRSRSIVIPLGSIEQHGPDGFIGTDVFCPRAIAQRMADQDDILVGPAIPFGPAPSNLAFPGTISMRASTAMAIVEDYVSSLARNGIERFYFLNGHGANSGPLRAACQDIQAKNSYSTGKDHGTLHFFFRNWWDYPSVNRLRQELYGEWEGMHATPSEIAITMALYPGKIATTETAPPTKLSSTFLASHAGDNHTDADSHRSLFPDGRVGSYSALANAEDGNKLLAAAVADGLAEYRAFTLQP